jgi:hypothetical protein
MPEEPLPVILPQPVPPGQPPQGGEDPKVKKIIRTAKQNCYTLFVLFDLFVGLLVLNVLVGLVTQGKLLFTGGPLGLFVLAGGAYAFLYLPLRWKTIMSLDKTTRVLGMIGGFGCIGVALLTLLAYLIMAK